MERVVRLLALVALLALLVAGCGKDTVSNPGGGSSVTSQGSGSPGATGDGGDQGGSSGDTGSTSVAAPSEAGPGEATAATGGTEGTSKAGPGEVLLRYNLRKGQKYAYEVKTVMDTMGQSVTMVMDLETSVLEAQGDKYTVEYKIADISVSASDPQMKAMFEQQMASMKGASFTADLDARGNITNMKGDARANMLQNVGGGSAFGFVFPDKPLKVGDSWTHSMNMGGGAGSQPLKINYKLTGVSRNVATLSGSGTHTMEMNPPSGQGQQGGRMTVESAMSGTTKVDVATGMIIESNGTFTTKMTGGGMGGQSQKILVTMKRK